MAEEDGSIGWYRPRVRAIIPIGGFHASRSLHKSASRYEWEFDQDFDEIIEACSERDETWISSEIKLAYSRLFKLGFARCCGVYRNDKLVGGVYAASFGNAMFGESMFHRETDAGKVALWKLVDHAQEMGFELFEVQFLTPHLRSLGAVEVEDAEYFPLLEKALR